MSILRIVAHIVEELRTHFELVAHKLVVIDIWYLEVVIAVRNKILILAIVVMQEWHDYGRQVDNYTIYRLIQGLLGLGLAAFKSQKKWPAQPEGRSRTGKY